MKTTLTGHRAIEYAARHGLTLSKHTDPTEEARTGLSIKEAREVAAQDPGLIYVDEEVITVTTPARHTSYRDTDGTEYDLTGDSVEALAAQLPEDYTGARLTVRDERDQVRGWIRSRTDWRAQ